MTCDFCKKNVSTTKTPYDTGVVLNVCDACLVRWASTIRYMNQSFQQNYPGMF